MRLVLCERFDDGDSDRVVEKPSLPPILFESRSLAPPPSDSWSIFDSLMHEGGGGGVEFLGVGALQKMGYGGLWEGVIE